MHTHIIASCAVHIAGLQPIYMPLGPDFLPDFDKIDVQSLREKRAKVGGTGRQAGQGEGEGEGVHSDGGLTCRSCGRSGPRRGEGRRAVSREESIQRGTKVHVMGGARDKVG